MNELISKRIEDSIEVKKALLLNRDLLEMIDEVVNIISDSIRSGGKLVLCGNGGSASDALHFAGEIVGRFQMERNPWPAIVLNADVASLTAIANDYSYEDAFAREAKAFVNAKDVFIGISTSGNSENIYRAARVAQDVGAKTVALLGKDGGKIGREVAYPLIVPCKTTARVQESHIMIIHIICELVEKQIGAEY